MGVPLLNMYRQTRKCVCISKQAPLNWKHVCKRLHSIILLKREKKNVALTYLLEFRRSEFPDEILRISRYRSTALTC